MKFLFPVCFFWYFLLFGSVDIQHFTIRKQILKKSITVKWQCPEFKGNESYAFKLLRTESKNGQPGDDADDVVGVFVGDECRGMAHPTYNARYDNSFVLLDVYGNADDAGTPLTFKVYDASTGIMYPVTTTSQPVAFSANVLVGKYADPLRIEAADKIEQATMLGAGWNWMSFYAKADDVWLAEATVDFIEDAICGSYKHPLELTFGKTTYVDGIDADDNTRWFDVHGRILNGKPTAPGVYVRSTYDASTGLTTTRKVVVR